jgi:FkbM family methyltransferase
MRNEMNSPDTAKQLQYFRLPLGLRFLRRFDFPRKIGILDRLYGNALAKEEIVLTSTANNVIWKLDLRDVLHRWMVYSFAYEGSCFTDWMKKRLDKGGVVIDSGANIGQALVYVAPIPNTRIFAFEPLADAVSWLRQCVEMHPDWKVEIIQKGLYSADTTLTLRMDGARSTTRADWYKGREMDTNSIEVVALDNFLDSRNEGKIDLWMLDVQGAELEAMKGAERRLSERSIESIYVRLNKASYREGVDFLSGRGYEMFVPGRRSLGPLPGGIDSTTGILAVARK